MEDGGVDRTVIDCWQYQFGQMADFPPQYAEAGCYYKKKGTMENSSNSKNLA
jgi:hypothetical protein